MKRFYVRELLEGGYEVYDRCRYGIFYEPGKLVSRKGNAVGFFWSRKYATICAAALNNKERKITGASLTQQRQQSICDSCRRQISSVTCAYGIEPKGNTCHRHTSHKLTA